MNLKTEEALYNAQRASQKVKELAQKERLDNKTDKTVLLTESETEDNTKSSKTKEPPAEYEKMLIRLEADVRNHIKIE